jgi:hypothetical protein
MQAENIYKQSIFCVLSYETKGTLQFVRIFAEGPTFTCEFSYKLQASSLLPANKVQLPRLAKHLSELRKKLYSRALAIGIILYFDLLVLNIVYKEGFATFLS